MKIEKLVASDEFILAIYYIPGDCYGDFYGYSVIDEHGVVLEPDRIFYTGQAAEAEAVLAINIISSI